MDLLSKSLLSLKFEQVVIAAWQCGAPWNFHTDNFPYGFCLNIMDNHCYCSINGKPHITLSSGDAILLPRGGKVVLSSASDASPSHSIPELYQEETCRPLDEFKPGMFSEVSFGGNGEKTHILGLTFTMENQASNILWNALPSAIVLRHQADDTAAKIRTALSAVAKQDTNTAPGEFAVRYHLCETLLITQIRSYILNNKQQTGFLAAINDKYLKKVFAAIHKAPAEKWQVAKLAEVAELSRSALTKRFQRVLQVSPIQYLRQFRMQLAANALLESNHTIDAIALQLGYESTRDFRRNFVKIHGVSPQRYRSQNNR